MSFMRMVLVIVMTLLPATATAAADGELGLSPGLTSMLHRGQFAGTPLGFRMLALSFVADGCASQADLDPQLRAPARRCVEAAYRQAQSLRDGHPAEADDGLWLSHLNLIMGAADRLGPCLDERQHRSVSAKLTARSLADRTAHAASFAHIRHRWPADQTATLASLRRFDRAHGGALVVEPLARWRRYIAEHAFDADLGLPHSEATGLARHAGKPRGCALTFETIYLHEVDPALAKTWWTGVMANYFVDRGPVVGFREWPPKVNIPGDADSGPIVGGIGAAATAFALPAAKVMNDGLLAVRLATTAQMVEAASHLNANLAAAAHTSIAEAIRFLGAHAHP